MTSPSKAVSLLPFRLLAEFARSSRMEMCGMWWAPNTTLSIRNIANSPTSTFVMDGSRQVEAMNEHGWPDAIWHTHPGNRYGPSDIDWDSGTLPDVMMVIALPNGRVGVWEAGEEILEAVVLGEDMLEIYKDGADAWRWRRVARNGEGVSASGESFSSKEHATRAAYRANPDIQVPDADTKLPPAGPGSGPGYATGGYIGPVSHG